MRLLKLFVVMFTVLFLSGCAANVKYAMDKDIYKRDVPINRVVLVDVIEDARPAGESKGTAGDTRQFMYSKDKDFKSNINLQMSQMLVEHLNKAKIFMVIKLMDVDNNLEENKSEMESLHGQGVDIVVIGNLKHFYGYESGVGSATTAAVLFGLVGAITEAAINKKTVGGNVEYEGIKVIDLNNKGILWKGNIGYSYQKKVGFLDTPANYSLIALKEANNKFCKKLAEVCEEDRNSEKPQDISEQEPTTELQKEAPEKAVDPGLKVASYAEYYRYLYNRIAKAVKKPQDAGSGIINASFILLSDGSLENVNILDGSSEDTILRDAVIKAIKDSVPFPPFPSDIKEDRKAFTVMIEFRQNS